MELPRRQPGNSHSGRFVAVRHPPADVPAAVSGQFSNPCADLSCTCHRAALGNPSAPDGVSHVYCAAGGVLSGPVLPVDALLLHPRRNFGPRTPLALVCHHRAGLPAGDGQQGGHGFGPVDYLAVRSGFSGRLIPRSLATALRRLSCPGVYVGLVGMAGDCGGQSRRLGRFWRRWC